MWLKLSKAGPDGARLLWGTNDGPYDPYQIGPATLAMACDAVREALAKLVHACGSERPKVRAGALRELAFAGAELYYVLFVSHDDQAAAKRAREALAHHYAHGDTKLRITGHPELHIPWALVFEGDPEKIPKEAEHLEFFNGFWGLKYEIASTLSGYNQPRSKLVRQGEKSKLLSLVHFDEATKAESKFNDELRKAYRTLLERPVGIAHDLESCRQLIEKAVTYDTVLHIFTHQDKGKLDLGDDESISVIKFRMLLDRLTEQSGDAPSYSLVMLNACGSATGDRDYSFVSAIDRPGMSGLIGTEAIVPRDFAALFAIRFLTLMLAQGKSVGESMTQLRHEPGLWPLSLLYGCYAQPDYRINFEVGQPA
jgi:hypothetical protein